MKRIAVIDSSPLINLVHLELATQLSLFFDVVHVPRQVQTEVNRRSKFRHRLNRLYKQGIAERCFADDRFRMLSLSRLHLGEAEAIVQAQTLEATYLVLDDQEARKIGSAMGFHLVGTVGILARLEKEGYVQNTHQLVQKLRRDLNCRISSQVVEDAIKKAVIPI